MDKVNWNKIEGDKIFIWDDSGDEFKIIKHIVFGSEDGIEQYRIQKSTVRKPGKRKYAMQK